MSNIFEGYVTKYALSGGVRKGSFVRASTDETYVRSDVSSWGLLKIGRDVFKTAEEAKADFDKRKAKRIASIRKQIDKVEKIKFPEGI